MAPKQKRQRVEQRPENGQDDGEPQVDDGQQSQDARAEARAADRRAGMAEIARRRAAHFANFREEGQDDDGDNIHAGGNEARTLGPWSSAVELVNEREKAAERRKAKLQGQAGDDQAAAQPAVTWQPKRNPDLGPRLPCPVPPLRGLCMDLLVEYIDCVDSLYGIPDIMRAQLAEAVCSRRKMTAEVAKVFAQDATSELVLPDCSQIDRDSMCDIISQVVTTQLDRLELHMCGRGFGDNTLKRALPTNKGVTLPQEAADAFVAAARRCQGGVVSGLRRLRLGGAYRLNDDGLLQVLEVAPGVTHLSIPDASRISAAFLCKLPEVLPGLRHLDLANCRGLDAANLSTHIAKLKDLHRLILDGVHEVDDAVLAAVSQGCPQLKHLSICLCPAVTDNGVTALAAKLPGLETLKCDKCDKVTDKALQAVASSCKGIKVLSVMKLPKVSDAGVKPIIQLGCMESLCLHGANNVTDACVTALATYCHASLTHLDISFCRSISNDAMGHLVDTCTNLTDLVVFGCSQLGDRFAHGHSNSGLVAKGITGLGTSVTILPTSA